MQSKEPIEPIYLGFEGEQWYPSIGVLIIPLKPKSGHPRKNIAVSRGDGTEKNKYRLYIITDGEQFDEYESLLMIAAKVHDLIEAHERLP